MLARGTPSFRSGFEELMFRALWASRHSTRGRVVRLYRDKLVERGRQANASRPRCSNPENQTFPQDVRQSWRRTGSPAKPNARPLITFADHFFALFPEGFGVVRVERVAADAFARRSDG